MKLSKLSVAWTFVFLSWQAGPTYAEYLLTAEITLKVNAELGPINRKVLGNNIVAFTERPYEGLYRDRGAGIWNPTTNSPVPSFVEAARAAGARVLRWPGGKDTRSFEWKSAVGPLANRPGQKFGLPEFLRFCATVGAAPLITLPDTISPADAADLLEYLNAPAGANPNGGREWSAVRVADGARDSWKVRWFELGNETFNSEMSAKDYAARYRHVREAMRTVDPEIELGAVLEDSENVDSGWTRFVLETLGRSIDFAIIHPYLVRLTSKSAEVFPRDSVALAAVSADADLVWRLQQYRAAIKRYTGEENIPLAVTEYNGHFVQELPIPYRHTMVNALHNADNIRTFLAPEHRVQLATFWQFANSYWGIVRGGLKSNDPVVKQPMQYVFELYNRYLGDELIGMDSRSVGFDFGGGLNVSARRGVPTTAAEVASDEKVPGDWSRRFFRQGDQTQEGGIVRVRFDGQPHTDYFHAYKAISVEPNTLYYVTARVRTQNLKGGKVGIAVEDARGWNRTFYQPRNTSLTGNSDWTDLTVPFRGFADTKEIRVMARSASEDQAGAISGTAEFGNVTLRKIRKNFGQVPMVVGVASRTVKKKEVQMVLLNKNLQNNVVVSINLQGAQSPYKVADAEVLHGRSPFSTNLPETGQQEVRLEPIGVREKGQNHFSVTLPPASVAGISWQLR